MSKLNFLFLMTAGTCFSCPAWEVSALVASGTQTHTYGLELKPASFINTEKAFKTASICFLGVGDCDPDVGFSAGDDYSVDSEKQCLNEGFTKLNCNSVQTIDGVCPYNPAYGQHCKCRPNLISCPAGQVGVGDSCNGQYASCKCDPNLLSCASNQNGSGAYCGGRYQSCVCKPEYQYTSSNCSYPRSISGASCGGKYTGCICPSGVSSGAYGCAQYYPSPCSGICKSAYSDNCRNRTAVSTPYGCAEYWSDCPSKCKTAYNDNCRNRTAASCPYGCASAFGDCQSKCQSCFTDNCRSRNAAACSYGCAAYWGDCPSKCQSCFADNCRNRSAVSVPANAYCSSTYSDCASKCSAWKCNSGYNQSGNACVLAAKCSDAGYLSSIPTRNSCERTTYQGLTCYKNCQRPVNIYEVWTDGTNICGGGPYISPVYKRSSDRYYSTFPRSECISSISNKTSMTLPLGTTIKINVHDNMGHTLCAIARRTPAFPYHRISCDFYRECVFSVENSNGYPDYMDIFVVYRKQGEGSAKVNGNYIPCDY